MFINLSFLWIFVIKTSYLTNLGLDRLLIYRGVFYFVICLILSFLQTVVSIFYLKKYQMDDKLYFVRIKEGERDANIVLCYKKNNQYYSHYKNKLIEDCLIYNVAYLK